jgi:hypothetical protein
VAPAKDLKIMLVVGALFLALAEGVFAGGLSADLLLAAPFFVLLVPLLSGRYLGEKHLDRLRTAVAARRRPRRAHVAVPVVRRPVLVLGRGGRAVAGAFFCRPPPALLQTAS